MLLVERWMRQDVLILAAGRVRSKKKKNEKKQRETNPAAPKPHHEIHSSPATATTSRRRATKHFPRVSPYLPASIDPGFVEIGLVQLSQSEKTTNVTHTHTDRQTIFLNKKLKNVSCEYDRLNDWNSTLQAAWCIRHVRWTCLFFDSFITYCLWTKPTISGC